MGLKAVLGLRSEGIPRAHCEISASGVKSGFGRRLVPLDEVDRFDVELREPVLETEDDLEWVLWRAGTARRDEPYEQLVLLTRNGRTIRIRTSRQESLGSVALQLNNRVRMLREPSPEIRPDTQRHQAAETSSGTT